MMKKIDSKQPFISIIVATYNAGNTIDALLRSITEQNYQNWECIIVDGASKDDTIEIVKLYVVRDSRIRYISEPDKGIYDAFNKGWKLALGEWIYYIGADDILLQNGLRNLLQSNYNPNSGCLYGNVIISLYGGKKLNYTHSVSPDLIKYKTINHQALIMRKSVIKELGGFDEKYKICADSDLLLKAIVAGIVFEYKDINIAIFSDAGVSSNSLKNIKEAYSIRTKYKFKSANYYRWHYFKLIIKKWYWINIKSHLVSLYYKFVK